MLNSNLVKKAHGMTREIKAEFPEVNYRCQFGLCLSYLSKNKGEVKMEMVELKGSEKQVKWAEEIRKEMLQGSKLIEAMRETYKERLEHPKMVELLKQMEEVHEKIETEEKATWFIDNRHALLHYSHSSYKGEIVSLDFRWFISNDFLIRVICGAKETYLKKNYVAW